ncbi:hypothetical protein Tco_0923062 [Tanacetum coccineum]|uniref:Reverse transcriptase Ty1/copia-type domain-containing protein n=1 Tax=Tanacetum coccineum TaxID=301880 RepID=A0ABQ5D2C5_9ASTR
MSNTNTNLRTQSSSVLQNHTVSSCSTSKVQEKTQLSRIKCMNSLRAIQSQLKFLIETLQDFGNMPIFKRTFSQDLDLLENHLTKEIISQTDCKTTLTKLRTTFENAFSSEIKARMQNYTRYDAQSFYDAMIFNMDSLGKYMLELILHQQRTPQLLKQKKLMQTQEDHSNPIPALNVDSLKVDLVVIQNTCSEKEDSNSENASNKLVKECSLNSETKDVHAIKYKMSKAKERCMAYFRSLHSHLQVLSKDDLKGTRIEHGFKRAFMSLFGQDVDTFTRTMLLNVDQLQKQLDKDEFQEDGSMTAFWVVFQDPKSLRKSQTDKGFVWTTSSSKSLSVLVLEKSTFDLESFTEYYYDGANLDREIQQQGEAEYVAAASCCGQVLWIQNQMLDYGFNFMNTKIYIDNESTICIVKNPVYHSKTKHIAIRHHLFIRDAYEKKLIQGMINPLKLHLAKGRQYGWSSVNHTRFSPDQRKNAKGDGKAKENAQSKGRTKEMMDEDKESDEVGLSTEDEVSTAKEGVSTDFEKVSTDRPKLREGSEEELKVNQRRSKEKKTPKERSQDKDKEEESTRKRKLAQDEDKEVDYEILDKKYPIIDWKTVCLGTKPQFDESKEGEINLNVVTRSNDTKDTLVLKQQYCRILNREDLNDVFQLVMDTYHDEMPEGFERVLWGDLKVLFKPDEQDEFWSSQHGWKIDYDIEMEYNFPYVQSLDFVVVPIHRIRIFDELVSRVLYLIEVCCNLGKKNVFTRECF